MSSILGTAFGGIARRSGEVCGVSYTTDDNHKSTLTSSLIFFQMILVISSPSSSTTGFWTTILLSAPSHHHTFQIDRPARGVAAAFDKHDVGRTQAQQQTCNEKRGATISKRVRTITMGTHAS